MELTLAAPAQADSKDVLGSQKDWSTDGFDPGVLRAELEALQRELERLNEQLGAAVVDGDERRMDLLEGRIDALTVRQKGLIAEIAEWEATVAATADRARRRQEAAERERKRRELVATRTQLYRSLSASLAHQAHIAQLVRELERLRLAPPVEQAHLEALRQRLSEAGLALDTLSDELSTCEDPERLQAAALHYQLLAGSAEEQATSLGESRSSPATVTAQPVGSDSPAQSEPQTQRETVQEDLRKLDELEERLRRMLSTFDGRGYQQAAVKEINRQLAMIENERSKLQSAGQEAGGPPRSGFFPGFRTPSRAKAS